MPEPPNDLAKLLPGHVALQLRTRKILTLRQLCRRSAAELRERHKIDPAAVQQILWTLNRRRLALRPDA